MSDSMFEKYQKPPAPVDFAGAKKSIRDQELVNALEAFYASSKPPPEAHVMPESEQARSDETVAYLKELDALHREFLPVLEKEIDFYRTNRTSYETTVFDLKLNYPLMHEEIEDELERREWFKDTGIGSNK
jgi:hypothetical protein